MKEAIDDIQAMMLRAKSGTWTQEDESWLAAKEIAAPYASLVHILRALLQDSPDNRFRAAIYSPQRGRLRDLVTPDAGFREAFQPQPQRTMVLSPQPLPVVVPLSQLSMKPVTARHMAPLVVPVIRAYENVRSVAEWRFQIGAPRPQAFHSSLNDYVREVMAVFGPKFASIHQEIRVSRPNDQALIQRFLSQPPRAQRPHPFEHSQQSSPAAQARPEHSLATDETIVTETLALLHMKQGHPEEAARIYQQLCLRYPEKKAYFTAQIEKIKQNLT